MFSPPFLFFPLHKECHGMSLLCSSPQEVTVCQDQSGSCSPRGHTPNAPNTRAEMSRRLHSWWSEPAKQVLCEGGSGRVIGLRMGREGHCSEVRCVYSQDPSDKKRAHHGKLPLEERTFCVFFLRESMLLEECTFCFCVWPCPGAERRLV